MENGKMAVARGLRNGIGCGSTEFHVLRPRPGVDAHYVYNFVSSARFRAEAAHHMTGAVGQKRVPAAFLEQCVIPLPDLEEQCRIVAEIEKQFSRLDEAVANLERVKANLKSERSSVLQAVTSGRLAADGKSAPREEEWRWLTIEELASAAPRAIQSGPFGSNLRHSEFQPSGKLVIGIDNIRDGAFSIGSNHRISEAKFKELEKYAARPGDVLITVMATIGRVCVVPHDIEPAIITKHVYRITVNRELAIPDYVAIALRGSREVRQQLMDSVQGQTRPGLNGGLIRKIRVPVPPLAYQESVVAEVDRRLSIVREVETEVDANLRRAAMLRQSILSRALRLKAP
jgi:type I restriction enzyme S subunit